MRKLEQIDLNKDWIKLSTKKEKQNEVETYYSAFGWEKVEEINDKFYGDTVHLTFNRKHKIKNKDELQLLQVQLNNHLNKVAKYEKYKNIKSNCLSFFVNIFCAILIITGIIIPLKNLTIINIVISLIFVLLGLFGCIINGIIIEKLQKKELVKFNQFLKIENTKIETIYSKAKKLYGVNNGK